jgi:hypothetical protein
LAALSGCKKDEVSFTGQVKVTYLNASSDLNISISPVENSQVSIVTNLKVDNKGTLTYDLNAGNYILTSSSLTFFPKVGFQIKSGETTVIVFDLTNNGQVQK